MFTWQVSMTWPLVSFLSWMGRLGGRWHSLGLEWNLRGHFTCVWKKRKELPGCQEWVEKWAGSMSNLFSKLFNLGFFFPSHTNHMANVVSGKNFGPIWFFPVSYSLPLWVHVCTFFVPPYKFYCSHVKMSKWKMYTSRRNLDIRVYFSLVAHAGWFLQGPNA